MKPKIAIVGGLGFIARNIVETLHETYEFVLIDRAIDLDFASKYNSTSIQCDILNDDVITLFEKIQPDYVINTVSIVTAARDLSLFPKMIDANLGVLLKLYEATKDLKSLKAFVQFGSAEEYGPIEMPFKETMREQPLSPYALAKQITTNTALMLNRNYGFPSIVVRPSNVYGKGQPKDKFIPYIVDQLRENAPLNLTPAMQKRDFIEVTFFAKLLGGVIENHGDAIGQVINIGSGESVSLKEIVEQTKKALKSDSEVNFGAIPYREGEMMDFVCDISTLESVIKDKLNVCFKDSYNMFLSSLE